MSKIPTKDLKKYCKYLLKTYDNNFDTSGKIRLNLETFIREGQVKDLVFKNSPQETKAMFIEFWKESMQDYFYDKNKKPLELMSLKEFLNKK